MHFPIRTGSLNVDFSIPVEIEKRSVDAERGLVGGYAYVSKKDGRTLSDLQGHSIDAEVLRDAVHEFMKSGRTLGIMHIAKANGDPVVAGEVVEMAVFAGDFRPPGMDPTIDALWVVAKVTDPDVKTMIKGGFLRGFSIGGKALLEEIPNG
jgi:hypothetical protein